MADQRGIAIQEVLLAAVDPEITYCQSDRGLGRAMHQRGALAIVVHLDTSTVITVLHRDPERWFQRAPQGGMPGPSMSPKALNSA